jgi:CHAT domain-containing protein
MQAAKESGVDRLVRLPFTREEALAIVSRAGSSKNMQALDFDASRETATSPDLARFRVVHFATHALLNTRHPELSGIVLSLVDERGRPQDGFLRLHDVFNLRLNAQLVVLSACQTALGTDVRGEGLIGLTRGFMHAGSSAVMASLWNIRDEATAKLMERFYDALLRKGLTPAAALRQAQLWMREQPRWRPPAYWAGFVLQGDWRSSTAGSSLALGAASIRN